MLLLTAAIFFLCIEVVLGKPVIKPVVTPWKTTSHHKSKAHFVTLSRGTAVSNKEHMQMVSTANESPESYAQRLWNNDALLFGELDAILVRELNEPSTPTVIDGVVYASYT